MVKPLLYFQNYFNKKKNCKELVYLPLRLEVEHVGLLWLVSESAGKHCELVVIIPRPHLQARKMLLPQRPQKCFQCEPLGRTPTSQGRASLPWRRESLSGRCCVCLPKDLRPDSLGDGATVRKPPQAQLCFKGDRKVNSGLAPGSGVFALATQQSGRKNQVLT